MSTYNATPHQATKSEVRKWFYKIPQRTVNQVIKAAIKEHNKTAAIQISIRTHVLNHHHLKFIFDELGNPLKKDTE